MNPIESVMPREITKDIDLTKCPKCGSPDMTLKSHDIPWSNILVENIVCEKCKAKISVFYKAERVIVGE